MKRQILGGLLLTFACVVQGCATAPATASKKVSQKQKIMIPRMTQSFALMDDSMVADPEISRRGKKARGTSEY
jgi:hypothetical protein